MSTVELPLVEPIVNTYQWYSYPLSVMGNHSGFESWLCNYYIQLISSSRDDGIELDFFTYSFYSSSNRLLSVKHVPRIVVDTLDIPIEQFIMKSIDTGFYVYLHLDDYYVQDRAAYLEDHNCHDLMINGYDLADRTFKISGFNRNRLYSIQGIAKFEEIIEGYKEVVFKEDASDYHRDVFLLRLTEDKQAPYSDFLNLNFMKMYIEDYINGKNTSERAGVFLKPLFGPLYGMNVYQAVFDYLYRLRVENALQPDIRQLHLLYEHKKIMKKRIVFLENKKLVKSRFMLSEQYDPIEQHFLAMKTMFLKYSYSRDERILDVIHQSLGEIIPLEKQVMEQFLESILA